MWEKKSQLVVDDIYIYESGEFGTSGLKFTLFDIYELYIGDICTWTD